MARLLSWWTVSLAVLPVMEGMAGEFYRCANEEGPPGFYQKEACQLLTDPTASPQPPVVAPQPVTAPAPLPAPSATGQPGPMAGPWTVTQILLPDDRQGRSGPREAIINHRRATIGTLVDGGQVREITRTDVLMRHPGGETRVPFGRTTTAAGFGRPPATPVTLEELGIDPARLLLLQQVAAGKELLLLHKGLPVARLLPVTPEEQ
ncbi:MAG: hypothetical protein H7838_03880 [Magnetococcus sp. DMHC-8]